MGNVRTREERIECGRALVAELMPYANHLDMGGSAFALDSRRVTVKFRMRKDRAQVVTLACWNNKLESDDSPRELYWCKTIAVPSLAECQELSRQLVEWLKTGNRFSFNYSTFSGYEDINQEWADETSQSAI